MSKGLVSIEGLGELRAKLDFVALRARQAAEEAVRQEVKAVGEDVEQGAPVRRGELRGGVRREAKGTDGAVRSTARHSTFVEHGTFKDRAQPFMAPAAERSRTRFPARVGALVKTTLEGIRS